MAQFALRAVIEARDKISTPLRRITSRLGPLRAGFRNVSASVRGLARGIGRVLKPLGLIGGVAAAAAIALTKQFISSTDELAKFLRETELAPQFFQEMRFAAARSGVGMDEFTKGMRKMSRAVGDLKLGTGTLITILKNMDPAFMAQLKTMKDNNEVLKTLFTYLIKVEDVQIRAAFATAIFGRAGSKLLPMFKEGKEGIEALMKEARRLGLALSDEALLAAENAQDSFENLSGALMGVKGVVAEQFLPFLTMTTNKLALLVAKNRELIGQKIGAVFLEVSQALARVNWKKVGSEIRDVWKLIVQVSRFLLGTTEKLGGAANTIKVTFAAVAAWILKGPLILAIKGIGIAIAFVAASLGAGATAIAAALIGAGVLIWKNWKPIKTFFLDMFDAIIEKAKVVARWLKPIGTFAGKAWGWIKERERIRYENKFTTRAHRRWAERKALLTGPSPGLLGPLMPDVRAAGPPLRSAVPAGGLETRNKAEISVVFKNAPPGTRVRSQSDPDVDLLTDLGISLRGAEAAL